MNDSILFSIVIPTRNRARTLEFCLNTCTNQILAPAYEIIVNDNSDNDETRKYVEILTTKSVKYRNLIKYHRRAHVCSMSENFEDAIAHAKGEFIIVIGDDDGILPMALCELSKVIDQTNSKIIKWSNALYNWPDIEFANSANYLGFSLQRYLKNSDGLEELRKSIRNLNYVNLPMLYINSAIHRDVIERVKDGDGRLFRSRSPDVYSSIVLSYYCGQFIDTSIPFTIAGLSHSSNGVSTAFAGNNPLPKQDFSTLNERAGLVKHSHVPNLTIYPIVDFADSFYFAKGYHFSLDDEFTLPRKQVLRACVERSDTSDDGVCNAIYAACSGESYLIDYVSSLIAKKQKTTPPVRLKPANLGADGTNLHLDTRDFDIKTIEDAVNFIHKIIWPNNAPLRYDLGFCQ